MCSNRTRREAPHAATPWPLSSDRLRWVRYPFLDEKDEEVAWLGIPLLCHESFWPCWPAYDLFGKTVEGCLFSACDLGRTLGPHTGAHSSFAEYPLVIGLALPRLWQNLVFTIPSPSLPLVIGLLALPVIGVWWWVDLFSLPRQTRKANEKIERTLL